MGPGSRGKTLIDNDLGAPPPRGRFRVRGAGEDYRAAMAARMSSRAARAAGQVAASRPRMAAMIRKTIRVGTGTTMSVMPCCLSEAAKATPSPVPPPPRQSGPED